MALKHLEANRKKNEDSVISKNLRIGVTAAFKVIKTNLNQVKFNVEVLKFF